jgi:y4mF family transcriptional regulator
MQISNAEDFGVIVKQARNKLKLTQSELAGASGTGVRFIVDLEHGKPTCELGKAIRVALMLGIKIDIAETTDQ